MSQTIYIEIACSSFESHLLSQSIEQEAQKPTSKAA